jgi:hypothetical protein
MTELFGSNRGDLHGGYSTYAELTIAAELQPRVLDTHQAITPNNRKIGETLLHSPKELICGYVLANYLEACCAASVSSKPGALQSRIVPS